MSKASDDAIRRHRRACLRHHAAVWRCLDHLKRGEDELADAATAEAQAAYVEAVNAFTEINRGSPKDKLS